MQPWQKVWPQGVIFGVKAPGELKGSSQIEHSMIWGPVQAKVNKGV